MSTFCWDASCRCECVHWLAVSEMGVLPGVFLSRAGAIHHMAQRSHITIQLNTTVPLRWNDIITLWRISWDGCGCSIWFLKSSRISHDRINWKNTYWRIIYHLLDLSEITYRHEPLRETNNPGPSRCLTPYFQCYATTFSYWGPRIFALACHFLDKSISSNCS